MNKKLHLDDLEDYAFYQSGLSADGCLNKLDTYAKECIKNYGRILLRLQKQEITDCLNHFNEE
jgi:hypothetical protein